jgi:tRNA pseudouridine38-40 synthase
LTFEITGEGFLRHMVRALVGTMIEVGRGARSPHDIERLIVSRDRHAAGRTAPANGLFLVDVEY